MRNYEKVVEHQKKIRKENEKKAITAINHLYDNRKLVTVKELVEMTGLSRTFFYKNEKVNETLRKVLSLQNGDDGLLPKKEVFNLAVAKSNEVLERQIRILENRCRELEKENCRLKQMYREV